MSRTGKFSPGRGSSKKHSSSKSLGAIEEDNILLSALDEADPEEGEGGIFTHHELFESELSLVDSQTEETESRPGTSVFIDLEAEERAFVSGSQQYLDAVETIRQLRQRLVRRTSIIDEIRKYYLRDVVTIKHIMKDVLTTREREQVLKVYEENLPSIDLTQALKLHAPTKCELQVAHCGECGGQLEIVMKDSDEVDMLKKTIMDCKDRESRFRIKLATLDAQIENTTREKAEGNKSHAEEKKFLYTEMKKVKGEVEKLKNEVNTLNKTNKRAQAENEQLHTQLITVNQASTQLTQQSEDIENLKNELAEVSTALKTSRYIEKTTTKELNEKKLELKTITLQSEEQIETIKILNQEKTDTISQINNLKVSLSGWVTRHTEASEECKNTLERAAELEAQVAFYASEKERLLTMTDASEETLQGRLIEAEEGCAEYKEENRRLRKDIERYKRQLEKSEDSRLVLAHEVEVVQHEKKEREEELLSIQNFIHEKIPIPTASAEAVAESTKSIGDLLQSLKVEARQRVGETPVASARVASVKLQRQQRAEARAKRGSGGDTSEVRINRNRNVGPDDDDDDDDIGNFDSELDTQAYERERDEEDRRSIQSAATKKGHKKITKKKEKSALKSTPSGNKTRTGGTGKTKKPTKGRGKRRPSLDDSPRIKESDQEGFDSQDPQEGDGEHGHELESETGQEEDTGAEEGHLSDKDQELATGDTEGIAEHQADESEGQIEGTAKARTKKSRPSNRPPSHPQPKNSKRPKSRDGSSTEVTPIKTMKRSKAKSTEKSNETKKTGRRRSFDKEESPSRQGSRPTTRGSATAGVDSRRSSLQNDSRESAERVNTSHSDAAAAEDENREDQEDGEDTETGRLSVPDSLNTDRVGVSNKDVDEEDKEKQSTGRQGEGGVESRVSSAGGGRRSAGSRTGKSPKTSARSHKSNLSEDWESASVGSREGARRTRSSTPGKRDVTSLSIKAAAMELPEVVSARSTKKKTITKITPVLDKKHMPRRNSASRLKTSKTSRSSRTSNHGYSDGEEEEDEGEEFEDIDEEEEEDADSDEEGEGEGLPSGLNTGATNTAANSDEDAEEESSEGEGDQEEKEQRGRSSTKAIPKKSQKLSVKAQKAPSMKIQVAKYDLVKKQSSTKHDRGSREGGLSPLAMGSPINSDALQGPYSPQHGGGSSLPAPRRRRSLPKCYSFSRHVTGLGSRLPSVDSADVASLEFSQIATAGCSPLLGRETGEGDNLSRTSYASGPTGSAPDAMRIAQLHDEFTAGVHRVPDPPSIRDEDGLRDGARIRTYVPIIPIEVKRYVDPNPSATAAPKKKFTIPVEEPVELEPLPEGHTALEEQLRTELLKTLSQAAGVKPNDMHRAVNATKDVLHRLCVLHDVSVKSAWSALQASRTGLDLHYLMRHVTEGMARCTDAKTGTVELAETVKRLLPLAGMSMAGPAVSNQWQEDVKLNPVLIESLFPTIDAASGKYSVKSFNEFFNTKAFNSTNTEVLSVLQEKAQLAEESAQTMRLYAANCSKFVTDKLTGILKDWAKAKGAFYEMDAKIAAEKDKVRKVLEARISELTKEKVGLSTIILKHEERIKALESSELQLQSTQFQLKKVTGEMQSKLDAIQELEDSISELYSEIYQRKTREKELGERIDLLNGDVGTLQQGQDALRSEVSKEQASLADTKQVLGQVSEERDHFQAQYERMVMQEDSRLNKLVHVQIQSEPAVQDLAIQTEFVAPPMTLRTIVASKNARGGVKAPLVMSQSLEVPSSNQPGALTSVMVDTSSSTFHPMSRPGTVMTAHSSGMPGSRGGVFSSPSTADSLLLPLGGLGTPPTGSNSLHRGGGPAGGALSARSVVTIDSAGIHPGPFGAPSPLRPLEGSLPSSPPRSSLSREDSFLLDASDFLSSAQPIDYEKSGRGLTSTEHMARLLSNVGDDSSVGSSRTQNSNKFMKKKAVKLGRVGGDKAGSSGHYHHVHLEESVPQWGSVHGPQSGGTRVDAGVVLGISGVGGVGTHTNKVYGTRGEFGANSGHISSSSNNTLSAAGSSLFRTNSHSNASQPRGVGGREVEVSLPEVRTQSYNLPTQRVKHFSGAVPVVRAQPQHPAPNLALSGGTEDVPHSGDSLHLMLDSPSLGGSSAYPGFDFDRDRRNPLRIAGGDLPASQEAVQGIVYNNRSMPGMSLQQTAFHTEEGYNDNTGHSGNNNNNKSLLQSASQGQLPSSQVQKMNISRLNQKIHAQQHQQQQQRTADSAHTAVSGVSEEILRRLRKELLSR